MADQNNQVQLKNFNRRTVLGYIRRNGTATKAGLASVTGLTFMAIKKILAELQELNLIRDGQMESGGMGRKAVSYVINENYRYTIGIHINKFITGIALLNLRGQILAIERYSMDKEFENQNDFVTMLAEAVNRVIEKSGVKRDDILGIGVGAPGPLDCESGVILTPPNMPMLDYLPLKETLEGRTGFPVFLNKDTNVIAFAEYWYRNNRDCSNLAYVEVDMGIGSGIIIDGKLNVGANCIAGEFGHITIDLNGPLCNCGNRGCLEAMSSGIAVLRMLGEQLENQKDHPLYHKRNSLTIEDVFVMTDKKDLLTISILNRSAFYVGVAVSNLINTFDPEMIILGGILIQKYPMYFNIVQDVANQRKVKGAKENFMAVSVLRENAGVIGAGEIVTDHFFNQFVNEVFH
ncbi:MAG: ROK family protein [Hungatella sp.]|uniref:ROK family transcriptional regulator n=1 Tax=Hungatella sp. TaxID=2613924 RepID=UPI00399A4339